MRRSAAAIAVVLVAAGCGGGSKSSSSSSSSGPTTTISGSPTTTVAGTTGGPTTTGATGPSVAPHGNAASTAAPATTPPTLAPGVKPAAPAAPGTYKYHQSGTSSLGGSPKAVPAEGSETIDKVTAGGSQTWHRTVDPSQPASDTVFLFKNGGVYLSSLVMRSSVGGSTQTFTCTFATPMPTPPWPPTVGTSFTGHADCGTFTVDVSGKVPGTRSVTVGGVTRQAYVVASTLTIHGQIEGTGTQTDWFDPTTSLILHEDASQNATYAGFVKISSSTTSDLESLKPQ